MSTEIKNTLFRFSTMRAPELMGSDSGNFVKHPDISNSSYVEAVVAANEGERKMAIENRSKAFEKVGFATRKTITKTITQGFLDFSEWLTSNRTDLMLKDVNGKIEGLKTLTTEQRITVWDNLFYQITTFKSGPVRESLFSILLADHFIVNFPKIEKTDQACQKLAQARIVVPNELFELDAIVSSTKKPNVVNTKSLDRELNTMVLKDTLEYYEAVKVGVEKAEIKYKKDKEEAYENAYDAYQKNVKKLYESAKVEEQIYTDPKTNISETRAKYVDLDIPEFSFEYPKELEGEGVSKLAKSNVQSFIDNVSVTEGFTTFQEVNDYVDQEIETTTEDLFEEADLEQTVVNYNGNVIPVSNNLPLGAVFSISGSYLTPTTLLFSTDFQNAHVVSADYEIAFVNSDESVRASSFVDTIVNNKLYLRILTDNEVNFTGKGAFTISGEITLNNNRKITLDGRARIVPKILNAGIFPIPVGYRVYGNGNYTLQILSDDGNGDDSSQTGTIDYVPSGQGIKRLGIADYRKVEQTVCCYVPGEVSHIENIMAREFKEKETRRLRRKEDTTTTSSEQETERLTDTTTTDRFEMNQEVASVVAKDQQFGAHAEFSFSQGSQATGVYGINAGADFATATSTEESNSQAVTYAKDVTERALDRVVQKTKEERVVKIVEEFEEKNAHGFDNRTGDSHISGVYRWVDKIYKNKVVNYGKRLMYEFMIPEPAAFHNAAISGEGDSGLETMVKPVDPRTSNLLNLKDYTKITEATYAHWAGVYNAEVKAKPKQTLSVSKGFNGNYSSTGYYTSGNDVMNIPEGYEVNSAKASTSFDFHPGGMEASGVTINIGDKYYNYQWHRHFNKQNLSFNGLGGIQRELAVAYKAFDCGTFSMTVVANCTLTSDAEKQWKIDTFNTIIKAYENKLAEYESKVTEVKDFGVNPGFFRQIENMVLRKNCITYLASQAKVGNGLVSNRDNVETFTVNYQDPNLESYVALVKFFEQAFEWNIMSYNFYPFYWAEKNKWKDLYNVTEFNDPLHRNFLQSGMARVVVTVRPGFEEVVNWYMATGQVWNGGQVPTMDDELFLSIVEELQQPSGEVEETWETRVPTSLTVIQAGSIGLNVEGLPCNADCDDFKLFDSDGSEILDADGNSFSNPLQQSDAQVGEKKITSQTEEDIAKIQSRMIENIDVNDGKIKLTTEGSNRQIVAQISVEDLKREMGL